MEDLANLEAERGNPEYLSEGKWEKGITVLQKKERSDSKEMCDFLILNISSLQLIPVNMIV